MPFGLGFGETILIFFIILIFFGPKRLPEMGASLGKGIRDFKRALNGVTAELESELAHARPVAPAVVYEGAGAEPVGQIAAESPTAPVLSADIAPPVETMTVAPAPAEQANG